MSSWFGRDPRRLPYDVLEKRLAVLTRDLNHALAREITATQLLDRIGRAAQDMQPVLDAIVEAAARLCEADAAAIYKQGEGQYHLVASSRIAPEDVDHLLRNPVAPGQESLIGRVAVAAQTIHIPDITKDPAYSEANSLGARGSRSALGVPLVRDGTVRGVLTLARAAASPFADQHIELATVLASQALVAIEYSERLEEMRARMRELSHAVEGQTAFTQVIKGILRTEFDLAAVLREIAEAAARLCRAEVAAFYRREGEAYRYAEGFGLNAEFLDIERNARFTPGSGTLVGRAAAAQRAVEIADAWSDPHYEKKEEARTGNLRSMIGVPLMHGGEPVAVFALARARVHPFGPREIELANTFAAQALIALENLRLMRERQSNAQALQEALEREAAVAEIPKLVGSSTPRLQAVLDTVVATAARLCRADHALLFRIDDGRGQLVSANQPLSDLAQFLERNPIAADRTTVSGRVALLRRAVQIDDVLADPDYAAAEAQKIGEYRTVLGIPLLRDGRVVAVLVLARKSVDPFAKSQIAAASSLAEQTMLAIENVRLLDEAQARKTELGRATEEFAALGDSVRLIDSDPDLNAVLDAVVASAARLSAADAVAIFSFSRSREEFRLRASFGIEAPVIEAIRRQQIHFGDAAIGEAAEKRAAVEIVDLHHAPPSPVQNIILRAGFRSLAVVPLLQPDRAVGGLLVVRRDPGSFPPHALERLRILAAEAALVVANAHLAGAVEEKQRYLETTRRHTAQLVTVLGHELRSPLNEILGYLELMLANIYGEAPGPLRGPLERVQVSGRLMLDLINDMSDLARIEAGQLALSLDDYSLADVVRRAAAAAEPAAREKNLAIETDLAPNLPTGRGDQRRIAQALGNVIAHTVRACEGQRIGVSAKSDDALFMVTISDSATSLGEAERARLFDVIQPGDAARRKIGVGLGLPVAKRIVEMHGGRLWVEAAAGHGTTFHFALPIAVERPASG